MEEYDSNAQERTERLDSAEFIRRDVKTRFQCGARHPRWQSDDYLLTQLKKCQIRFLTVTGRIKKTERSRRYCEVYCSQCKKRRWILIESILRGLTSNCRCQRGRKFSTDCRADTLGERYDAMIQRCNRGTHVSSHNYKGRGIRVLFKSREHFIKWACKKWPNETFQGKHFHRIDNDGHYSPENLLLLDGKVHLRIHIKQRHRLKATAFPMPGFQSLN